MDNIISFTVIEIINNFIVGRQAPLRSQAVRVRRSDQARVPQEGQDHQEDRAQAAVQQLQAHDPDAHQGHYHYLSLVKS